MARRLLLGTAMNRNHSADSAFDAGASDGSGVRCQRSWTSPAINLTRRVEDSAEESHVAKAHTSERRPDDSTLSTESHVRGVGQILLADNREKVALGEVLGAGGMGIVYAGYHRVVGQPVVVKVIRPEYAHIPELVARFQREAEILASIDAPSVVRLLDCDVTTTGLPYMVLERLEGHDLAELIEASGKLKPNDALALALDAARALAPLHAKGIVHRDIKPDNLFLHTDANGARQLKLIDFGVALATQKQHLTLPGTTMGSLHYMSPEQLKDCRATTPASDVWSLGVVMFQLLSGELPFRAQSEAEFTAQVLTQTPLNLRAVSPSVPKELARIVGRCLDRDPWKRYSDAAELYKALTHYNRHQNGKLRIARAIASVHPASRTRSQGHGPRALSKGFAKRHIAAAGVAAGIAFGHFMPHQMRDELSRATLGILSTHIAILTGTH